MTDSKDTEARGRYLDEALGLKPLAKKTPDGPQGKTEFPARALRDAPGQAPIIESETT